MADGYSSIFDYGSAFTYSRVSGLDTDSPRMEFGRRKSEDILNAPQEEESRLYQWIRGFITVLLYVVLIVGFPFFGWFCLRRVKPLERCVVFRLGQRLPMRGAGLLVTFPCGIDQVFIMDTRRVPIKLINEGREQSMTSDRSIVRLNMQRVTAHLCLLDPVKSCTHLVDPILSCEQYVKLSFQNMVAGAHVEELEERMHLLMDKFLTSTNERLRSWGWELIVQEQPEVSVIERADPLNDVMNVIKSVASGQAGPGGPNSADNPFAAASQFLSGLLPNSQANQAPDQDRSEVYQVMEEEEPKEKDICSLMEDLMSHYSFMVTSDLNVSVTLESNPSPNGDQPVTLYFCYTKSTGRVTQYPTQVDVSSLIQIKIKCSDMPTLVRAIQERDSSLVKIDYNL